MCPAFTVSTMSSTYLLHSLGVHSSSADVMAFFSRSSMKKPHIMADSGSPMADLWNMEVSVKTCQG